MALNVSRNIQFTKLIKAPLYLKEFNFRKIPGAQETFHVDVNDDRGNRIMFTMLLQDGTWKITGQIIPKWILDIEMKLHTAIEEELNQE